MLDEMRDWAKAGGIPVVRFKAGERKAEVMAPNLEAAAAKLKTNVKVLAP